MSFSQWVGFVATMAYAVGVLGFSCGITAADKHRDRPLLVILLLGLTWPIWVAVLAGVAWQRLIESDQIRERDR